MRDDLWGATVVRRPARPLGRPVLPAGRLTVLGLLVPLLLLLTSCGEDAPAERQHGIGEGPLSALLPGVRAVDPDRSPTLVTFGAITLCVTARRDEVVLDAVRYRTDPTPLVAGAWLRSVPAAAERATGQAWDWRPLLDAPGFPGRLVGGPWLGDYTRTIEGTGIEAPCDGASDLGVRRTELVTALQVAGTGTEVTTIFVDYHVGPDDFTLVIPGQQRVCGTRVRGGQGC